MRRQARSRRPRPMLKRPSRLQNRHPGALRGSRPCLSDARPAEHFLARHGRSGSQNSGQGHQRERPQPFRLASASPTTLQSNTRPASTARSSWSDIRLAPMPSCSWASISARRACRWRWLCRSTAPALSPHPAMSQRVIISRSATMRYMRKGAGFRGELYNIDVSRQAGTITSTSTNRRDLHEMVLSRIQSVLARGGGGASPSRIVGDGATPRARPAAAAPGDPAAEHNLRRIRLRPPNLQPPAAPKPQAGIATTSGISHGSEFAARRSPRLLLTEPLLQSPRCVSDRGSRGQGFSSAIFLEVARRDYGARFFVSQFLR